MTIMPDKKTKYIFVTGGVISSLGKGVVSSSIGCLLKSCGYSVSMIKIDPYLNVDAGTMRPTEHGEVFVTKDGLEADQDLGTYERFLHQDMTKHSSMTSGSVYQTVIQNERSLKYDGKCVQLMNQIPREILRRLKVFDTDFVIVEIGGTVGDYENIPFIEAVKLLKRTHQVRLMHVVYLLFPDHVGELKTKPAQHSVKALNSLGLTLDFLVGRSKVKIDDVRLEKLSLFCGAEPQNILSCPNASSIYDVPRILEEQDISTKLQKSFGLKPKKAKLVFKDYVRGEEKKEIKIGIVGKYFATGDHSLADSYVSVIEAVNHACKKEKVKGQIIFVQSSEDINVHDLDAVIVPGGFGSSGIKGKLDAIKFCRKNKTPFLGLCYGMQLSVVEHAQNVLGWKANTSEIDPKTPKPVITLLENQKPVMNKKDYGGSMRLGEQEIILKPTSQAKSLYGKKVVSERHRHRFEVNPDYLDDLFIKGLSVSGFNKEGLVEVIERTDHPYFLGIQGHPEFTSRPLNPHPLFLGLVKAAVTFKNIKSSN